MGFKRTLKKNPLTKIAGGIVLLLLTALAFFCVMQAFFPVAAFNVFGFRFYIISYTQSMEPLLSYHDLICVKQYDFDKLRVGDIVTFEAKTKTGEPITITHEVVEIFTDSVTGLKSLGTKGVNVPYVDNIPVTESGEKNTNKYIGKLAFKDTFSGHLLTYLSSGYGIVMFFVDALGIVGIFVVIKFYYKAHD